MTKFIATNVPRNKIVQLGLAEIIPERKSTSGRGPSMVGPEMNRGAGHKKRLREESEAEDKKAEEKQGGEEVTEDTNESMMKKTVGKRVIKTSWKKAKREPTRKESKALFAKAMGIAVTLVLKNHCYHANGKIYHQKEKGIIGLDLMRSLARVYMLNWAGKYQKLTQEITENSHDEALDIVPQLLGIYVDDTLNINKILPKGARFVGEEKKIIIDGTVTCSELPSVVETR